MKVIVVTNYLLSSRKGAAYSRILAYSDALKQNVDFDVIELDRFVKKNPHSSNLERNEIDDITYLTNGISNQSKLYKVFFSMFDFISAFKTVKFISKNYTSSESRILLYSSNFFLFFFSIFHLGKIKKFNVIVEKNESEIGIVQNLTMPRFPNSLIFISLWPLRWLFAAMNDLMVYLSNGVIVISSSLESKYRRKKSVWRIPILVDVDRFSNRKKKDNKCHFIYMGAITKKKDALFKIVEAIGLSKNKLPSNFIFEIIGDGNKNILNELESYILKFELRDFVKIRPSISYDKVPEFLMNSNFGMLIRENNLQNKYGFSTKLGEYLAAGLFVISSDTSDNLMFLNHKENSYIVKTKEINSIADAINYCSNISDSELNAISNRNYELVQKSFSSKNYRKTLLNIFS